MSFFQELPTSTLRFSVVVCAYTEARWDDMLEAVKSLRAQSLPPAEIILVIDHNPSLLERTLHYFDGSNVRIIENKGLRGLSSARNSGMAVANGDIIAFIDEDAVAAPDWLAQLAKVYHDPAVMGAGGAIIPSWSGKRPLWFPEEFDWVVGCTYRGMPTTHTAVRNLIGCNMSFRQDVCELNGGFRDGIGRVGTLPVGCEETEYCIRANQRWPGKSLIYNPNARVFHNVSPGRATWRYFFSRTYAEGVSKALIGQFVGTNSSLSSEATYTLKTLPKGVLRGLGSTLFHADLNGLARAAAIIIGFTLTAFGYGLTRVTSSIQQTQATGQLRKPLKAHTAQVRPQKDEETV